MGKSAMKQLRKDVADVGDDIEDVIEEAVERLRDMIKDGAEAGQDKAVAAAAALAEAAKIFAAQAKEGSSELVKGAVDEAKAHPVRTTAIAAASVAALASIAILATRKK